MNKLFVICCLSMLVSIGYAQEKRERNKYSASQSDRVDREDHFIFKDGQLYQMKTGVHVVIQSPLKLNNGLIVSPNGSYELSSGERLQLQEGELLDIEGKRYKDQDVFNQRALLQQGLKKKPK